MCESVLQRLWNFKIEGCLNKISNEFNWQNYSFHHQKCAVFCQALICSVNSNKIILYERISPQLLGQGKRKRKPAE